MARPVITAVATLVGEVVMAAVIATLEHPAIVVEVRTVVVIITTTITAMVMEVPVRQEHLGKST
jgi:hypothetical protein